MKSNFFSILGILLLICLAMPFTFSFAGGTGTLADPYQIATIEDLNAIYTFLDANFVLTKNLDFNDCSSYASCDNNLIYRTGIGWIGLGTSTTPFKGSFDGNYNSISNLYMNHINSGLFKQTSDSSSIFDLHLIDVVGGTSNDGFLASTLAGQVTNVHTSGILRGSSYQGGIGAQCTANISKSSSHLKHTHFSSSATNFGGICGSLSGDKNITESYAVGTITFDNGVANFTGGLVALSNTVNIVNSYSDVNLIISSGSFANVGDLIGRVFTTKIINSYAKGYINTTGATIGGLVGSIGSTSNATSSYWDINTTGQTSSALGTGYITAQMKIANNFVDWNFDIIWAINKIYNNGYPNLDNNRTNIYKIDFNVYRAGTSINLNNIDLDCNVNTFDKNNNSSPFFSLLEQDIYECGFLVQNGYDRNTQTIIVDSNKTYVIYLTDTIAPTTTIIANTGVFTSWNTVDGNIALNCNDLNGSGCNGTRYRINSGSWINYTVPFIISIDGNNRIDYNSVDVAGNSNAIKTIWYALDKTAPSIGTTTISGFTNYNTYLTATGTIIGGTAIDLLSDINNLTCEYTINGGSSWAAATWNTDHCEKNGISISNGLTYTFNTRIKDKAGNQGIGTPTSTFTGDTAAPLVGNTTINGATTYGSYINGITNIIGGSVSDLGSGINNTTCEYTTNNGSSWIAGNWLIDHCYFNGLTIVNGTSYTFNTRIKDNLNQQGTGTVTSTYIGDVADIAFTGPFNFIGLVVTTGDTNYITSYGNIVGPQITDAQSGIDTSTCEFSDNNGVSYTPADWNAIAGACMKQNYSIDINNEILEFKFKVQDNVDNNGTSYSSGKYTAILNVPVTTFNGYQISNKSDFNLLFNCKANIGCKSLYYKIDSNINYTMITYDPQTSDVNAWFSYSNEGTHSITYFSSDAADINETPKTTSFFVSPIIRFEFMDENNGVALTNVITTLNGYAFNSGANSYIDFNTIGINPALYNISFTKAGYGTRYYTLDTNTSTDINKRILLLPNSLGATIDFKFYKPNGIDIFPNVYIDANNDYRQGISGRLKTNSLGEISFFLPPSDTNYSFTIHDSDGNIYVYRTVTVTINRPKDERDSSTIAGIWGITVSGLSLLNDSNISGNSKTFNIYSNTVYTYNVIVDSNSSSPQYYSRTYFARVDANLTSLIIQPYLISTTDGSAIRFITQNNVRESLPGIDIYIYKVLNSQKTLISSQRTDVTGSSLFYLTAGATYYLELYRGTTFLFSTDNYLVVSSPVYITVGTASGISYTDINLTQMLFTPNTEYVPNGTLIFSQLLQNPNLSKAKIIFWQYNDFNGLTGKTNLYIINTPCYISCQINTSIASINFDKNKPLYIDVNTYDDKNLLIGKKTKKYSFKIVNGVDRSLPALIFNVRKDMGCSMDFNEPCGPSILVAALIALFVVGFLIFKSGYVGTTGMTLIGLFILGIFTYVGWFYWPIFILITVIGLLTVARGVN